MARKRNWIPTRLSELLVVVQTFAAKLPLHSAELGLTQAQVDDGLKACDAIQGSIVLAENCKTTMQSMTQWRDMVLKGNFKAGTVPPPPTFPVGGSPDYDQGSLLLFMQLRDLIVKLPGYTRAIGEDLMIVGADITPKPDIDVIPEFKVRAMDGYFVRISGSLQGFDAMKLQYRPKFGPWREIGFLTALPGVLHIETEDTQQPQAGKIRGIFIRKNTVVGNYSPEYPVIIS
jgi:hypothetical protein